MPALAELAAIGVGATARLSKTITTEDIRAFAALSGDYNPLHVDAEFARATRFQKPVAHGMLLASLVSTLVGMEVPGPGALWMRQSFVWPAPVFAGDTVELTLRVTHVSAGSNTLTIEVNAVNQAGKTVMQGEGAVMMLEQRERKADRSLSERVALVSGGARGIGAAVALHLAKAGAAVAVNYLRDEASAANTISAIEQAGGRAVTVRADITDRDAVREAVESVQRHFGKPVDLLVNNATIPCPPRPFLDLSWNEIQDLFDVQIRGALHCCQAVLPAMMEHKSGCIVNLGSVLTRQLPPPQWAAFVMAKSALAGLTRSLASEFGPQGIRVNMVSPGLTETESTSAIPERLRKVQAMQTPLRRLTAPEDVAKAVVFLCSEAGSFITGADLPVSGGIGA